MPWIAPLRTRTIQRTHDPPAVVLAHMIAALPFGVIIVSAAIEELPPEIEEAGLSCGATPAVLPT
jgi:ABC-type spermidine/putrescine transport system permease subunit II